MFTRKHYNYSFLLCQHKVPLIPKQKKAGGVLPPGLSDPVRFVSALVGGQDPTELIKRRFPFLQVPPRLVVAAPIVRAPSLQLYQTLCAVSIALFVAFNILRLSSVLLMFQFSPPCGFNCFPDCVFRRPCLVFYW